MKTAEEGWVVNYEYCFSRYVSVYTNSDKSMRFFCLAKVNGAEISKTKKHMTGWLD